MGDAGAARFAELILPMHRRDASRRYLRRARVVRSTGERFLADLDFSVARSAASLALNLAMRWISFTGTG